MVKPTLRTKSIGFKVREKEYAQLDAAAETSGRSLGEWCREVLLASVNGHEPKAAADSAGASQVALLAELVALRESCSMCSSGKRTARPLRLRRCKG